MRMESEYKYMVCTQCMTYNHSPYILETLKGFAIQQTSFPIVFCVIDDASPDGEADILRQWTNENLVSDSEDGTIRGIQKPYGTLLFSCHKDNSNAFFAILLLSENHHQKGKHYLKLTYIEEWMRSSKYHALCEGDDYWICPDKLQMQVDFMESHPDYVLCHTDFDLANGSQRNHDVLLAKGDYYFPQSIIDFIHIGTATSLYRAETYYRLPKLNEDKDWPMGDYPMWIEFSKEGKIKYFNKATSCYRVVQQSASHGNLDKEIAFANAIIDIRRFYAKHFGITLPNNGLSKGYFVTIMKCAYKYRSKETAKRCFKESIDNNMLSVKLLVFYLATISSLFGKFIKMVWY